MERVTTLLTELATCLCAQILTDNLPPVCFCGVMPGEVVALDYAGQCDDVCGMAWVRLVQSYPSATIGQPSTLPGNCGLAIGVDVEMSIVRCIDVGGPDGMGPEPAALAAAAVLQQADMMTMWRAVACCRNNKDWVIGAYSPYGPEGGLVGGTLTISLQVM